MRYSKLTLQNLPTMKNLIKKIVLQKFFPAIFGACFLSFVAGCQTTPSGPAITATSENQAPDTSVAFREGDVVKVVFPGATKLDTTQAIRRDGKISLPVLGEITAAGLTPSELEKQILAVYGSELVSKEVNVTLESSVFSVFVNGAVVRPGKVPSNRPLTALEAIMESGGFDYARANLKAVRV